MSLILYKIAINTKATLTFLAVSPRLFELQRRTVTQIKDKNKLF